MPCIMFFFFPSLSLARFYTQISYRLMKRTVKQVKQRFCSCLKVVAALAQARDRFKSLRSGLILFLHLGTAEGFSIIDKLVIRWELGLFLCLFPLPTLFPLPSRWRLIQVMSHFFSTGQLRQNARELYVLENRTTFQSNTLIDYFFFPVVVLLLFSDRLLRFSLPEIIIRIYAEIVREGGRGFNFNNDGHFDKTQSMFLITWIF